MTITIDLTPDQIRRLTEKATAEGQEVSLYVRRMIERELADGQEGLKLAGTVLKYEDPFGPAVPPEDWDAVD
jgi:hypothetical protein